MNNQRNLGPSGRNQKVRAHETSIGNANRVCADRNEPFFVRFCKERAAKRINSPRDAQEFLRSIVEHPDRGDSLNRLSANEGNLEVFLG